MFKVTNKQILNQDFKRLDIHAPEIASRVLPGQFVSIMTKSTSERIPLTVVESDPLKGVISVIFQENILTTKQLSALSIDDEFYNILGPLGTPSKIEKAGTVICVATGTGATQILPICRAHKRIGSRVICIIGAKNKKSIMLETQLRMTSFKLLITTDDGSYMKRGLATDLFRELLPFEKADLVYAVGSVNMMESVSRMTKDKRIPTRVFVNPLMLDGIGICGSCRLTVNGQTVLACTDGPEFNGHQVDYKELKIRMNAYEVKENTLKELVPCNNLKQPPSPEKNESGTLAKFLSGILKNKY